MVSLIIQRDAFTSEEYLAWYYWTLYNNNIYIEDKTILFEYLYFHLTSPADKNEM